MPGPFSGTPSRTDWLLLCEMAEAQLRGREADAAALCGAAGPPTPSFFPAAGAVPSVLLVALPSLVLVSVTGTNDAQQMAANVVALGLTEVPGVPGRAHQFWAALGQSIARSIRETLSAVEQGRRVVFVGHSLGGAVAQVLAALLLAARYPDVGCYTAGAPRVGDPAFAAAISPFVWRLEDAADPVVSLPPIPTDLPAWVPTFTWPKPADLYVHAGTPATLDLAGNLTPGSTPLTSVEAVAELLQNGATAHRPVEYVRRLAAGWGPDSRAPGAGGYPDPALLAVALDRAGVYYPRDPAREPGPVAPSTKKGVNMPGFFNSRLRYTDMDGERFGERVYYPGINSMAGALDRARAYISARVQLLGQGIRVIKHTVSSDDLWRDWRPGFIPVPKTDQSGVSFYNADTKTGSSEFAWTTMLIDYTTNDGIYHGRTFLSGMPPDVARVGRDAFTGIRSFPAFATAWDAFTAAIGVGADAKIAFKGTSREDTIGPRMRVTGAAWAAGVQTVTTGPLGPGGPVVDYVPGMTVRIGRTRGPGVAINGTWVVLAGGVGTFTFNQPTAPGFTWVRGGVVRPLQPALITAAIITPLYFTSHKRANPLMDKKGRRSRSGGEFQYPRVRPPSV